MSSAFFNKITRPAEAIIGILLFSFGVNLFIAPVNLYNGGILGISQLIRSCLILFTDFSFGSFDIAGILYYAFNIPLFVLAYKGISKHFFSRTVVYVTLTTFFLSAIPVPVQSFLPDDVLGSCLFGGIMCGAGLGLALRSGGSLGGTDIIGIYFIKKNYNFSIGKVSLLINFFIYIACFFLFDITIALYSIVYSVIMSLTIDLMHTQNINVQVLIISKHHSAQITKALTDELGRGVTRWQSIGGYTSDVEEVLYSVMSKYELSHMQRIVAQYDPHAFVVINDKVRVLGNFIKRL